jgi:cathepsin F
MRILFLLALVVLFATVLAITDEEREFQEFQKTYFKTYSTSEEYNYRLEVFRKNLKKAKELDAKDHSASYGVTKFSDLTEEEFRSTYLMRNFKSPLMRGEEVPVWEATFPQDMPTSYDWTTKGVVTPVYNQAQCGSCWAFSTTENIESMWALAGHNLTSLSMQQIVSCDKNDDGCGGGDPPTAYQYVISAGGLEYYKDYPYTSGSGINGKCKFDKSDIAASIKNWTYVTKDLDETVMQSWTYQYGPPSICVDASTWSAYKGGVIGRNSGCGKQLDHCVQITGWDVKSGTNVWVVRNSWGTDWGYAGYLYVEMGYDVCGIAQECTSSFA